MNPSIAAYDAAIEARRCDIRQLRRISPQSADPAVRSAMATIVVAAEARLEGEVARLVAARSEAFDAQMLRRRR